MVIAGRTNTCTLFTEIIISFLAPEMIAPPTFSTTPSSVIVYWKEPEIKNGIIISYTLYKAVVGGTFSTLYSIAVNNEEERFLQYTDTAVEPFTSYQYYVEATNGGGSGRSSSANILTQEAGKYLYFFIML